MSILSSHIDPRDPAFQENDAQLRAAVHELDARLAKVTEGGGEKARKKHTERGKLLPRERIAALLDPGSPFLELSALAAEGMYDGAAPAAGLITGIGAVNGDLFGEDRSHCAVLAYDYTCRCRTKSSPTRSTSAASSTTRPA